MNKSFIISGSGGQGILLIGKIFANICMLNNFFVTYNPCYGAEIRGGAVNCQINVSDEELYVVKNDTVDCAITLNQDSFDKFLPKVKSGGTIIANSSLIKEEKTREDIYYNFLPFTQEANRCGNAKLANSLALGVLNNLLGNTDLNKVKQAYEIALLNKTDLIEQNFEAYQIGYNFIPKEQQ